VAVLWLVGLARLHDLRLLPGTLAGLALCVWTIYVIDRTLDTFGRPAHELDKRHAFYRRFRTLLLVLVIPGALALLGWMAVHVIPAGLMWQCLALGMLVALYLAVYAAGARRTPQTLAVYAACLGALILLKAMPVAEGFKAVVSFLVIAIMVLLFLRQIDRRLTTAVPKELAGGLLFALGCTTAIRFYGSEYSFIATVVETLLLTALFTCNLTGITAKETEVEAVTARAQQVYPPLLVLSAMLAIAAMALAHFGDLPARQWQLGVAVFGGVSLLALLHLRRRSLSTDAYRALADIAVAVPVWWLLR